ncbi:MAG: acyltransferase family protein [Bacteroidota bacterium]
MSGVDDATSTSTASPVTATSLRRYDVDAVRTIAIGLLIVYHCALSFTFIAGFIGFPQNDVTMDLLWVPLAALNVWRIPILFLISGMGVYFAMRRRGNKAIVKDRTVRILVPLLFSCLVLWPLFHFGLLALGWEANYNVQFGHLWFLLNIYVYALLLVPLFGYLKANPDHAVLRGMRALLHVPGGIFLLGLPLALEAWLVAPEAFSAYALSAHGWALGFVCFLIGYLCVSAGETFWASIERHRRLALGLALLLYAIRLVVFEIERTPKPMEAFESMLWMLAVSGFAARHLNAPSAALSYFSQAVYPIYIVHMPIQFIAAYFILGWSVPAMVKLLLLTAVTLVGSWALYEYVLRRINVLRPLFGMKSIKAPAA